MSDTGFVRIGELAARLGVSVPRLRMWEQRYGVVRPTRTAGGTRLYSAADQARLQRVVDLTRGGMAAGDAARAVLDEDVDSLARQDRQPALLALRAQLEEACLAYDERRAHDAFDRLIGSFDVTLVLAQVIVPFLRELGERWAAGDTTVGQEHFASTLLRARLLALARGWERGGGRLALLACPPGELHDIGLVVFGLSLRRAGWRAVFLGADTPVAGIEHAAEACAADLVVLSAVEPERFDPILRRLRLPDGARLALAGRGARRSRRTRAAVLRDDAVEAAAEVVREFGSFPTWRSRGPGRNGDRPAIDV